MGAAKKSPKLEMLKNQAKALGITFSPNIGYDKLLEKVKEASHNENIDALLEEAGNPEPETNTVAVESKSVPVAQPKHELDFDHVTKEELASMSEVERTIFKKKKATRLRRVIVNCLNAKKQDLPGEVITVGNSVLGSITKYIPFGIPWHIPEFIYNNLLERKYLYHGVTTRDLKTGREERFTKMMPEYSIQDLPPLTKEELKQLAQEQAAGNRIDKK